MDFSNAIDLYQDTPAAVDYMIPGQQKISMGGNMARLLLENELDVGTMRPYVDNKGRPCFTRNRVTGWDYKKRAPIVKGDKVLIRNDSTATLRTLDWIQLDEAVVKSAKQRMRVSKDLREAGLVYMLPNGIAKTVLQFQQQSDISGATISMDGLRQSESDRPTFTTVNFPIPIIHKDFSYPLRQILASRTGYSPLDTTTAELAGRRVAEQVEQLTLGSSSAAFTGVATYGYGGASIYGYTNWPSRLTYTITLPTAAGWTPQNTIDDILAMKTLSQQSNHFGPWMLYFGLAWDKYMDEDYKPTFNDTTLRQRLRTIDGILDARTVDYIGTQAVPDYSLIMVQQTTDVVRMVIGMDITTVQWESHGGMQLNFKVMCVMVPQLRTDAAGQTGIVHGS